MHRPKVPQKLNFIVILNAWTWIPMQIVPRKRFGELDKKIEIHFVLIGR